MCLVVMWQLFKSNACLFLLCLENIFRRNFNLLTEDSFKSFSLAIGVQSLLIVCLHGERVSTAPSVSGLFPAPACHSMITPYLVGDKLL